MFPGHDEAVAALLRARTQPPPDALAALQADCCAAGRTLASALVEAGVMDREELLRLVAGHLGLEFMAEVPTAVPDAVAASLPADLARRYGVAPLRADARSIELLTLDPFDATRSGDLAFALNRTVRLLVADPAAVARLQERLYGAAGAVAEEPGWTEAELQRLAAQTPVVGYVERVLSQAVRDGASDVHFEPFGGECKVRCRIDGALRDAAPPAPNLVLPVISRLKVMAGLNIAERRLPQDGRLRLPVDGRTVDLRVSTLPTQSGESVVLRVLDRSAAPLDLADLGMPAGVEAAVREIVQRPNGIVLVTGPTGSGKTTTLYSCLRLINTPDLKILTAEDPVEYEIEGVMQLPVNPAIGLTFAAALRSFLRQDPDVLMVGEIRDLETAQTAIQAALTGHLVLSTLHTNDAVGAVTRLIDMGVEPYLLCATLEAVLAQRLVRCVCPGCAGPWAPPEPLRRQLGFAPADAAAERLLRGRGCEACAGTGFKGRIGIFEWLRLSEPVRELVMRRASAAELRERAGAEGMMSLRAAGLDAVRAGRVAPDELLRCT